MKTISFSVEDEIAKNITKIARQNKKSKSDVLRDMYKNYMTGKDFANWLDSEQQQAKTILKRLAISSDKELEDYLESNQTYEGRT